MLLVCWNGARQRTWWAVCAPAARTARTSTTAQTLISAAPWKAVWPSATRAAGANAQKAVATVGRQQCSIYRVLQRLQATGPQGHLDEEFSLPHKADQLTSRLPPLPHPACAAQSPGPCSSRPAVSTCRLQTPICFAKTVLHASRVQLETPTGIATPTLSSVANSGHASVSILTALTPSAPKVFIRLSSRCTMILQGPHQVAEKMTTRGTAGLTKANARRREAGRVGVCRRYNWAMC